MRKLSDVSKLLNELYLTEERGIGKETNGFWNNHRLAFEKSTENGLQERSQLLRGYLPGQTALTFIPAPGVERFGSATSSIWREGGSGIDCSVHSSSNLIGCLLQCQTALLEPCAWQAEGFSFVD